jgi:hypothetical protein
MQKGMLHIEAPPKRGISSFMLLAGLLGKLRRVGPLQIQSNFFT